MSSADGCDSIDVVLPVLNEYDALPWVLSRIPDGYRAIVVDNGSTDGSAELAKTMGATVVQATQRGFGAACWAGLQAATADIVCFMDADASMDPLDLVKVVDPVRNDVADLVMGARDAEPRSLQFRNRIANRYLASQISQRANTPLTDLGPMRAIRRNVLISLDMRDRRSGWPLEMVLRAAHHDLRICEVRVVYRARVGKSKVTGTLRGTLRAVRDMRRQLNDPSLFNNTSM